MSGQSTLIYKLKFFAVCFENQKKKNNLFVFTPCTAMPTMSTPLHLSSQQNMAQAGCNGQGTGLRWVNTFYLKCTIRVNIGTHILRNMSLWFVDLASLCLFAGEKVGFREGL